MNSAWQAYLRDRYAIIENNCVAHFGNLAAERKATPHETIIADLSCFGLIQFSGNDARDFLQNQLTCDLRETNVQTAQHGAYCSPKGRILANFTLWRQHDHFLMQLPSSIVDGIQKRLSMYVLRAEVQLAVVNDAWVQIGLAGANASAIIEKISSTSCADQQPMSIITHDQTQIIMRSPHQFMLITPVEHAPLLWEQLNSHSKPAGTSCWEWLTIQAGIPIILAPTQETFIPQMINLDKIGGVSFKKGCYPGQEIVARTQYLGKLKRHMILAHIDTAEMVKPGDLLYSTDMADQSCGDIVNAAPAPAGGVDALAVIQQSCMDTGAIHWQSSHGPILIIKRLAYLDPPTMQQ